MRKKATIFAVMAVAAVGVFLSGCGGSGDSGSVPAPSGATRIRMVHLADALSDKQLRLKLDNVDVLSDVDYGVSKTSTEIVSNGSREVDIIREDDPMNSLGGNSLPLESGITTFIPIYYKSPGSFGFTQLLPNKMSVPAGSSGIRFINLSQNTAASRVQISLRAPDGSSDPVVSASQVSNEPNLTKTMAPGKYRFAVQTSEDSYLLTDVLGQVDANKRYTVVFYGGTNGRKYDMALLPDQ